MNAEQWIRLQNKAEEDVEDENEDDDDERDGKNVNIAYATCLFILFFGGKDVHSSLFSLTVARVSRWLYMHMGSTILQDRWETASPTYSSIFHFVNV